MRVVVTDRRFPDRDPYGDVVEAAGGELVYGDCVTEADAIEFCADADVIIGGFVPITEAVMDAAGDLDLVMRHATGYDNVDVREATARGIPVSNVPGYAPRDIASHALALLLSAAHAVVYHDRQIREGPGWGERERLEPIHDGTLGIVGFGRIGRELPRLVEGFDTEVIAHDPYLADDLFELGGAEPVEFDALLSRSDAISIHASLDAHSHHLFDADAFRRMKDSAVLVNTGRGPIVDEVALAEAVESGEIRAAGLDVFESEPPDDSPVLDSDRIVCSSHRAGGTPRAGDRVVEIARAELERALEGEPLRNVVNREIYQYRGEQVTRPGELRE